ncbi:hypothetical protein MN608_09788 [Microdochium nivale]|nr:hypothetical protein MN608_09788 [Microdochium nivale]
MTAPNKVRRVLEIGQMGAAQRKHHGQSTCGMLALLASPLPGEPLGWAGQRTCLGSTTPTLSDNDRAFCRHGELGSKARSFRAAGLDSVYAELLVVVVAAADICRCCGVLRIAPNLPPSQKARARANSIFLFQRSLVEMTCWARPNM